MSPHSTSPVTWSRAALTCALAVPLVVSACTRIGQLVSPSPYDAYRASLQQAGLEGTALARDWTRAGEEALRTPLTLATPFTETGYLPPGEAAAVGYRIELKRGRRLALDITFETSEPARLFVDLFELRPGEAPQHLASLDPDATQLLYEIERDGTYVVRVQPELLRGGRFTIVQRTLASLPFPIEGATARAIQSVFGAMRDAGTREHEGIDIFAARSTPVVAVIDGVARPSTNALGGNVVWLRGRGGPGTIYYAHLERWAIDGSTNVSAGDVLGYVGNTGNARSTPPHLHFGIYDDGAIDPSPFLRPDEEVPVPPAAPQVARLGTMMRTSAGGVLRSAPSGGATPLASLEGGTIARAAGASSTWFRVSLPDRSTGYVAGSLMTAAAADAPRERLQAEARLLERPAAASPLIAVVQAGMQVEVLGSFAGYELLRTEDGVAGWRDDGAR